MISAYTDTETRQLLDGGIQALEDGQRSKARALLSKALQLDAHHEWAWYYLSWTMKTVPGSAWCLERVLDINPQQPHAKERLRELTELADTLASSDQIRDADAGAPTEPVAPAEEPGVAEPPETMRTTLTPELGELAAWLVEIERLLDAQELQLTALENRAEERETQLQGLQREADALGEGVRGVESVTARLQSESVSVIEAHRRMAGDLDGTRRAVRHTKDHLGAVEQRLSEAETRVEQVEQTDDEVDVRLGALESRVDTRDAQLGELLDELQREAEALEEDLRGAASATARLESENASVVEAHRRLAGDLDGTRRAVRHTTEQLGAVERRLSEAETRVEQARQADDQMAYRLGALEGRGDERDARLVELQREANALRGRMQEANQRLADDLETLRDDASHRADHLGLVEQRLLETETRVERAETADDHMAYRVGALEGRGDERDARLVELQREANALWAKMQEAEAIALEIGSDTQSVIEAHQKLAVELQTLRDGASRREDHLALVEQRVSATESRVDQAERADSAMDVRLGALEIRADERDAELDEVRFETLVLGEEMQGAQAATAQLRTETQSVVEAQLGLAGELDDLLAEVLRNGEQLDAVERRLSEGEARLAHTEGVADALEGRVGSLEDQVVPLSPALQGVREELGKLDQRTGWTETILASLKGRVARLQREYNRAFRDKPGWAVVPIMALILGLILLSVGALEVYPYMRSRFRPDLLMGRAQVGADSASDEPTPSATPVPGTAEASSATEVPEASGPAPGIRPLAALDSVVTVTPTQTATPVALDPDAPQNVSLIGDDTSLGLSATESPSTTVAPPTSSPTPPPPTPLPSPTPTPAIPTRLMVPDVGIDAAVVPVSWQPGDGTTGEAEGTWEVPDGGVVGWHDDSAPLGVRGNTVLNGHNTTEGEVFRDLYRVETGDTIIVYAGGATFTYLVSEVLILPELGQPREVRDRNASYLLPTEDERLTVVTCHPYGSLLNRLIVIAYPA